MTTAVDSSLLIDLVSDDPVASARSDLALQKAAALGDLVVCDLVIAEVAPTLTHLPVQDFLKDWNLIYKPSTLEMAVMVAAHFRKYLQRGGKRGRIVVDFVIGAHARLLADCLLTSDRGFRRDYFKDLVVIAP